MIFESGGDGDCLASAYIVNWVVVSDGRGCNSGVRLAHDSFNGECWIAVMVGGN